MLQALEFLGLIGWMLAGAGTTLAAAASAFGVINFFRHAIGRQIKSEMSETLTKLGVKVETLVEQGKAYSAALAERGKAIAALAEQGRAHSAALAEQGRAHAEQARAHAEQAKANAEQAKANAEQAKANAEQGKALAEQGKAIAALAEQGRAHSAALAEQAKALAEQEQGKAHSAALAEQGKAITALEEQGKETRAGMRQLEMKVDKTAADVNWIRGVLEGFGRNPEIGPEARTPVSDWREDGDNASP